MGVASPFSFSRLRIMRLSVVNERRSYHMCIHTMILDGTIVFGQVDRNRGENCSRDGLHIFDLQELGTPMLHVIITAGERQGSQFA